MSSTKHTDPIEVPVREKSLGRAHLRAKHERVAGSQAGRRGSELAVPVAKVRAPRSIDGLVLR